MRMSTFMKVTLFLSLLIFLQISVFAKNPSNVFYLQKNKVNCEWKVFSLTKNMKIVINTTEKCPTNLNWDSKKKAIYYTIDSTFSIFHLLGSKKNRLLAKHNHPAAIPILFWVDQKTGYSRHLYMLEVNVKDITKAQAKKSNSDYFYDYKGKKYPLSYVYDGVPHMAFVVELVNDKWKNIKTFATTYYSSASLGIMPAFKLMSTSKYISKPKDNSAYEVKSVKSVKNIKKLNRGEAILKRLGKLDDDEVRIYSGLDGAKVYCKSVYGDTSHGFAPVIVAPIKQKSIFVLKGDLPTQLTILTNKKWLLVREEHYALGKAFLYNLSSSQPQHVLKNVLV